MEFVVSAIRVKRHYDIYHAPAYYSAVNPRWLRAGVDILTISQWLGHASVITTNRYATTDLEMKRKAIEQAQAIDHTNDDGAATGCIHLGVA